MGLPHRVSKVRVHGYNTEDALLILMQENEQPTSHVLFRFFSLQLHAFKLSDVPTEGFCPPAWGLCHSCGHKGPWGDWSIQPWSLWEEVPTLRKDARSPYSRRDSAQSRPRRGEHHGDPMLSFASIHGRPDGQREQLQLRLPPRRLRGQEGPAVLAVADFRQPGGCYSTTSLPRGIGPPRPSSS